MDVSHQEKFFIVKCAMGVPNLDAVSIGPGPGEIMEALRMHERAKILADPTEALKKLDLDPKTFHKHTDQLIKQRKYNPNSLKKNVNTSEQSGRAMGGITGALASMGAGKVVGPGHLVKKILGMLGSVYAGQATGGAIGKGRAVSHNKDVGKTQNLLDAYGIRNTNHLKRLQPLLKPSNA